MQDFIIGLGVDTVDPRHCWWKSPGDDYTWEHGHVLVRCGACGHEALKWSIYTLFDCCGDRPFVYCNNCNGAFILCVNTGLFDMGKLHHDTCCRVLTAADQHEIPNFEEHVFWGGKPLIMMFIVCRALAITHLGPIQFEKKRLRLVPKCAQELATKAAMDNDKDPQLVELREPVFDYGGHNCHMDYRGVCPACRRETVDSVTSD
jgi:hypothetical protein